MARRPNVVRNSPTLLHAVALVGPNHAATVRNIRNMQRSTPPSLYGPALQIVSAIIRAITNDAPVNEAFAWGQGQAKLVLDPDKRRCAQEVVAHLRPYFLSIRPAWFRSLDIEFYQAGPDLQIPVRLAGLFREGDRFVVLVLQPWRKTLTVEQKRAAVSILWDRLQNREELQAAELHFVDISIPEGKSYREFRQLSWANFTKMDDAELKLFTDRLYKAWQDCEANPEPNRPPSSPRRPSDQTDMFEDNKPSR